ncbi:HlyD family efflux transporter periplasmic adaptor subunit [Halomonas sp. MCCC 1A11036]|uniref:HlyD family efflux transporter periplasmic adaptor subunit n=1 Tax=Billgrantia zhangzhouensis TaxID=2733481 RepID=A0ABS9AFR4_9GAMM|nr:HlyD family efflux transporter periplasmic adaptor subunit [Halomonas zhangzhouensis]MCE8020593.1 HlyD family efflux transporter periplasmic adaptor subunit [Halomonas zhangzhouensis]
MADHYSHDDPKRYEPTLGEARSRRRPASSAEPDNADHDSMRLSQGDRLQHERRDERGYIRVTLPFRVDLDDSDTELNGNDVSLGGFSTQSQHRFEPGDRISASLLMMAGATELIVPLKAECLRATRAASGNGYEVSFEITEIEPQHRELLRQIIRSALSGRSPNVEGLIGGEDPQTPRKRQATKPLPPARPPKPMGRYILLFIAIGLLALVGAATAYRNFMLIEPSFAAVTAPRIDIRAPGPGILGEHDLMAGDRVERDQLLTNVVNSELESDLILAEAAIDYNNRLLENLREHLENGMQEVSLANSAQPASGDTMTFESVSPEIAQARIEQFETVRDYESSRIAALDARMASNDIYSPCNCLVAWALSSADGVYINESERIMTLIRTDEDDVLVEALVHMNDISRIEPNQQAYVTLANANQPIRARVRNVALDVERQPRAGFPSWVRQQQNVASVLLVPEEPLPAESVGQPVDVRFTEAPLLGAASERIWQGVRSVIQFGDDIYRAATEDNDEVTDEG